MCRGDEPPSKKRRTETGAIEVSQLDLDDLHDASASAGIILEMQDRQRYFEAQGRSAMEGIEDASTVNRREARSSAIAQATGWAEALTKLKLERKPAETALRDMTEGVAARLESQSRKSTSCSPSSITS
jgi:transcription initiation factor TFIIH subunit 1